ncbi:hypothetical protein HQ520_05485 [bacterium]|nr:hypothetical protein [bacterium]
MPERQNRERYYTAEPEGNSVKLYVPIYQPCEDDPDIECHHITRSQALALRAQLNAELRAPEEKPLTVLEIVSNYLSEHGYDGLYGDECGCDLSTLMDCSGPPRLCCPGYKTPCPPECGEEHEFHIRPVSHRDKPEPSWKTEGIELCPSPHPKRNGIRRMNDTLTQRLIVAIDYDGTLAHGPGGRGTDPYPNAGEPDQEMIDFALRVLAGGHYLILDTCRMGHPQIVAIAALRRWGLDIMAWPGQAFVNQNVPERINLYGGNPRKISADLYIDNKATAPWGINPWTPELLAFLHDVQLTERTTP